MDTTQLFKNFMSHDDFKSIMTSFSTICSQLGIKHNKHDVTDGNRNDVIDQHCKSHVIYKSLKKHLVSNDAKSLWKILDTRRRQEVYNKGKVASGKRVSYTQQTWVYLGMRDKMYH